MIKENNLIMFSLIRSAILGTRLSDAEKEYVCETNFNEIFSLLKKHDLSHLLLPAVEQNSLYEKIGVQNAEKIKKSAMTAVFRCELFTSELQKFSEIAQNEKIPFMPLKGAVIRDLYNQPWHRMSSDIDILLTEENTDKLSDILTQKGYEKLDKDSCVISLMSPNKVHFELHHDLMEKDFAPLENEVLKTVWENSQTKNGYCHTMSNEMFYFYHIAHMAKHFKTGGCGIKPFIDIKILQDKNNLNREKLNEMLKTGGLLKFSESAEKLSKMWFENLTPNDTLEKMQFYILDGGVYGNKQNSTTLLESRKGGKIGYLISKVFIPYNVLKFHYPILKKHPLLTPIMQVARWFKLLFSGRMTKGISSLYKNKKMPQNQKAETREFLKNIGL